MPGQSSSKTLTQCFNLNPVVKIYGCVIAYACIVLKGGATSCEKWRVERLVVGYIAKSE